MWFVFRKTRISNIGSGFLARFNQTTKWTISVRSELRATTSNRITLLWKQKHRGRNTHQSNSTYWCEINNDSDHYIIRLHPKEYYIKELRSSSFVACQRNCCEFNICIIRANVGENATVLLTVPHDVQKHLS